MSTEHPLFAVRLDQETYTAIRSYAARHADEMTLKEIMQDMIQQYLRERGEGVDTPRTHAPVRLKVGRRRRTPELTDAIVILDDDEAIGIVA